MEDESNSVEYYRQREEYERLLATNATSAGIRKVHLQMADRYREMIREMEAAGPRAQATSEGLAGSR